MLVQTTGESYKTWLRNVPDVGSGLSWFHTSHDHLRFDGSESIDHNFSFHRLDRVDDHTYCLRVEHFLWFLGFDIGSRQPASETWMGVIPSNWNLISSDLLHHFHELGLIYCIDRLYTDSRSCLWHRENVDHSNGIIIVDFSNHEAHNLKWDTSSRMFQHLKKRKWRDVNLLTRIGKTHISTGLSPCSTASHSCLLQHSLKIHFILIFG